MKTDHSTIIGYIKFVAGIIAPFIPSSSLYIFFSRFAFIRKILPEGSVLFLIAFAGALYTGIILYLYNNKKQLRNKLDWTHRIVTILVFVIYMFSFIVFLSIIVVSNITDGTPDNEEVIFRAKLTIGLLLFSVTFTICNFLYHSYRKIDQNSRAITCTCVPFKYTEGNPILKTYLILNQTYQEACWMFPGGHFDIRIHDNLENIAIDKAKIEAGLTVETMKGNLFNGFSKVHPLICPDFLIRYNQDSSARCYQEKGHRIHFDYIYICNIMDNNIHDALNKSLYHTLEIEINLNRKLTKENIDSSIKTALLNISNGTSRNAGEHINEILYLACLKYLKTDEEISYDSK